MAHFDGMEYHFYAVTNQTAGEKDILVTNFKTELKSGTVTVDELAEAEIIAAVERSHIFLLFLNKHTLSSWPVQLRVNAKMIEREGCGPDMRER